MRMMGRRLYINTTPYSLINLLKMQSGFNPEMTAQDIRSKSFLKSRGFVSLIQILRDKHADRSSSGIIESDPAHMSRKPKMPSRLSPSTTSVTIHSIPPHPTSPKVGIPMSTTNLTPSMPAWAHSSPSTPYPLPYPVRPHLFQKLNGHQRFPSSLSQHLATGIWIEK